MAFTSDRYCGSCGEFIETIVAPAGTPPKISGCCEKCNKGIFRSAEHAEKQFAAQQAEKVRAVASVQRDATVAPVVPVPVKP